MADSRSKPKLYCAWFCPFAHRAWIAMLANKVDFDYVEQDPYNKTTEWLSINPRGLVPTVVHNGKSIYESSICVEYIDEVWPGEVPLLPKDPYQRAYARIWGDFIGKKINLIYFRLLMGIDKTKGAELREELLKNYQEFSKAMDPEGPFFQGKELSYVDIMLAPWANMMYIIEKYRNFVIPLTPDFERYHKWENAVTAHPSVAAVSPPKEKMLEFEKKYADNTAKSELAEAMRKGKPMP